jgi:uncharacterized protein
MRLPSTKNRKIDRRHCLAGGMASVIVRMAGRQVRGHSMEAVMKSDREIKGDVRDEFDNSFDVPLPPAEAWPVLSDIRRVAPCLPGAELTGMVGETTYQGRFSVPLGPATLAFAGTVEFEELDPVNHTARLKARGAERGKGGGASGTVSFRLEPAGLGSKVLVHTDLALSGAAAQYADRAGMIQATAAQIMAQFADNLRAQIGERAI